MRSGFIPDVAHRRQLSGITWFFSGAGRSKRFTPECPASLPKRNYLESLRDHRSAQRLAMRTFRPARLQSSRFRGPQNKPVPDCSPQLLPGNRQPILRATDAIVQGKNVKDSESRVAALATAVCDSDHPVKKGAHAPFGVPTKRAFPHPDTYPCERNDRGDWHVHLAA